MRGQPAASGPTLFSEYADDPDMIELIELFVESLPDRTAALRQATEREDFGELRHLAHQMKGAAAGYGYRPISELAQTIESLVKSQSELESVVGVVDELVNLMNHAAVAAPKP